MSKIQDFFRGISDKITIDMIGMAARQYALELERLVVEELDRQKRNATGDLRKSITHDVEITVNQIILAVGSNQRYAPFVEFGTKPHFPPFKPIHRWVVKKGIGDEDEARSIQWAIFRKGTKAHPFLQLVFDQEKSKAVDKIVAKALALAGPPLKGKA